jgi:hypothetical protein
MNPQADHVLLTRFNLPTPGVESLVRAREGWLRSRAELFERYCLPSVRAQTNRSFHWIIYFDPESPRWLLDRIRSLGADGTITPIFRESVSPSELLADIREVSGARHDELLTTNLDNDDGLARDFVERLHGAGGTGGRSALYLANGLIKSDGALYLRTDRTNAFCSVRERWEEAATCWADWHNMLGRHMAVRELGGKPAWLQVVHGGNVSNRIRGRRVGTSGYGALFADGLLDDIDDPGRLELLRDRVVAAPGRFIGESGRTALKSAALRVGGRQGLERVKVGLGSLATIWKQ